MIRELSIAACWSLMDPLRLSSNPILLDAVEALLQELDPWSMLRWQAYDQLQCFRSALVHRSCGACRRSQVLFCRTKGQMPNRWKKRPRSLSWQKKIYVLSSRLSNHSIWQFQPHSSLKQFPSWRFLIHQWQGSANLALTAKQWMVREVALFGIKRWDGGMVGWSIWSTWMSQEVSKRLVSRL